MRMKIAIFSLLFVFGLAFGAKKLKFEPNITGTFDGNFKTGGAYEFDIAGTKVTGKKTITAKTGGNSVVSVELTYKDKPLKFENKTKMEMKEGALSTVKTIHEDFTLSYGGIAMSGEVDNDTLQLEIAVKFKDATYNKKQGFGDLKFDFGPGLAIKGKRVGLTDINFDLSIGDKKIQANTEVAKLDIFKGTMKVNFAMKADNLTDEEFVALFWIIVLSENFSALAN